MPTMAGVLEQAARLCLAAGCFLLWGFGGNPAGAGIPPAHPVHTKSRGLLAMADLCKAAARGQPSH